MEAEKLSHSDRNYTIAIGVGLALFPVHNRWLVDATSINGQATLFLPVFGALIFLLASMCYLRDNWRGISWGDRKVYIPLLVIAVAMGLSGITADTWGGKFAPLFMGGALFSLYLVARKLGKDIFLPLAIGAGVASLGVIISGLFRPGILTGGVVFEYNYDIVVGYVLLGVALFIKKDQWILASLALVALFLSGSPEGVFVLGIMTIVVLLRRDWGKKLILATIPVILIAGLWFGLGYGQELYGYTAQVTKVEPTMNAPALPEKPPASSSQQTPPPPSVSAPPAIKVKSKMSSIGYRWEVIKHAMANIEPLGDGYNLTKFSQQLNVHNVPLVIVQQLGWVGIPAGIAWLWVSIWCLARTRWKYVWIMVLALSVFDHFIWTQLAPWWWAIIGVTTAGSIKTDLMFKGENPAGVRAGYMARKFEEGGTNDKDY